MEAGRRAAACAACVILAPRRVRTQQQPHLLYSTSGRCRSCLLLRSPIACVRQMGHPSQLSMLPQAGPLLLQRKAWVIPASRPCGSQGLLTHSSRLQRVRLQPCTARVRLACRSASSATAWPRRSSDILLLNFGQVHNLHHAVNDSRVATASCRQPSRQTASLHSQRSGSHKE